MALGLLGVRLLLAAVFAAAGAGKLGDRPGFRKTLAAFGAPGWSVGPAAALIPLLELAAALLLVPAASARWGALAGAALLAAFTASVAATLAKGRTPECSCFGTLASEPIGAHTIARNLALLACALLLVMAGPGAGLGEIAVRWDAASADERFLALTSLALLAALVVVNRQASHLRSATTRLSSRVGALEGQLRMAGTASAHGAVGLPPGTPAPPFDLPRLEGDRVSIDTLTRAGRPILLVFSDAHCSACGQLWRDVGRWQKEYADTLTIAVICGGPAPVIEMKVFGTGATNVLLRGDEKLGEAYNMTPTPSAVLVSADGRIDSAAVVGVAAIRELVAQRARD
jgi:uncharacterized membrane protein YphA (DoxX/SURF4 family)